LSGAGSQTPGPKDVRLGIENGALLVGMLCLAIALFSLSRLQETFHKDLDYFEEYL
jgi:hypothetical protein